MSPALKAPSTSTKQDEEPRTLNPDISDPPYRRRPHVIARGDAEQAGKTSQPTRVSQATSSSYWGPSELAVSGTPARRQDAPTPFQLVKAWDGLVSSVGDETFVVRIVPLDGAGLEEEAEFPLADVPEEDRPLVRVGAPLFWFVGYETARGRRRRTSELKMRRINVGREPSERWLQQVEAMIAGPSDSEPTEG